MIGSIAMALVETPVTTHLDPEPSYCVGRTLPSKLPSLSQWLSCTRYGMRQPVPGWLTRAGYDFGDTVVPTLAVLAVIAVAVMFLARR